MRLLFVTATDTMRGTSSGPPRPRGLRHEIYIGVELYRPAPDVPAARLADGSQRSRREDSLSVLGIASPDRRGSNGHESEAGVAPRRQVDATLLFDPPSRDRRCPRADKRSFRHRTAKRATSRTNSPRERCCGWQERNRNHRGTSVPRASPLESQAAALRVFHSYAVVGINTTALIEQPSWAGPRSPRCCRTYGDAVGDAQLPVPARGERRSCLGRAFRGRACQSPRDSGRKRRHVRAPTAPRFAQDLVEYVAHSRPKSRP
jgi:hypothetical protein